MKEMPRDLLDESFQEMDENEDGNSDDGIALFGDSDDAFVCFCLFHIRMRCSLLKCGVYRMGEWVTHNEDLG